MPPEIADTFLVAIDPGLRAAGVAVFRSDGTLVAASCERNRARGEKSTDALDVVVELAGYVTKFVRDAIPKGSPVRVVSEWPRVYQRPKSKGDPNDLLPLSACAAACAARLKAESVASVRPDEWKGQMPTERVIEGRVLDRLTIEEARVYAAACAKAGKTLSHNVTDAVGIGLHALGRFEPVRAIAR